MAFRLTGDWQLSFDGVKGSDVFLPFTEGSLGSLQGN